MEFRLPRASPWPETDLVCVCPANSSGLYSFHAGVNLAMCDGSVRFTAEGADPEAVLAMFSRAGGKEELMWLHKQGIDPILP